MSVHSTSPIMSRSDVQVIPMEEQRQRSPSWTEGRGRPTEVKGPVYGYQLTADDRKYIKLFE